MEVLLSFPIENIMLSAVLMFLPVGKIPTLYSDARLGL